MGLPLPRQALALALRSRPPLCDRLAGGHRRDTIRARARAVRIRTDALSVDADLAVCCLHRNDAHPRRAHGLPCLRART